jgi:cytochrome b561
MIEELRAWARTHTEEGRYSPVGQIFHWVMAVLVLFQLGWGFYTSMMGVGGDKILAYQVHSAAGLPVLVLAVLRIAWQSIIPGPVNDADNLPKAQEWLARFLIVLFYISFFALPLSGWVMWSSLANPGPLYLGGVVPWPELPLGNLPLMVRLEILDAAEDIHQVLVWMLLVIVPLHVGAALKHHFWDRHDVLSGMLPEIPDSEDSLGGHQHRPRQLRPRTETSSG